MAARIWAKWVKIPKLGFLSFLKFGSLVFLAILYNDSLQQCLTSRRRQIHEKKIWGFKFGPKGPKSCLKLDFLPFSHVCSLFFFEMHTMIACNNVLHLVKVNLTKKIFGDQILTKTGQNQPQSYFFCHFLKFGSLVFL